MYISYTYLYIILHHYLNPKWTFILSNLGFVDKRIWFFFFFFLVFSVSAVIHPTMAGSFGYKNGNSKSISILIYFIKNAVYSNSPRAFPVKQTHWNRFYAARAPFNLKWIHFEVFAHQYYGESLSYRFQIIKVSHLCWCWSSSACAPGLGAQLCGGSPGLPGFPWPG